MILSANSIRRLRPVEPFVERGVVRGRSFGLSVAGYDIRVDQNRQLCPGQFSLASSMEKFTIPKNIIAFVKDKSSWARRGLSVFNTVIEPGWEGYLTLELMNNGWETLDIYDGDPIAQIIFEYTDEETDGYNGKYQNQESGPQIARYEL
jgi:dCTP deaminase